MTGRPKGSQNKIGFRNWQPKKWTIAYETVLFLHLNGKTNKEIGVSCGYSEVQVGNILNSRLCLNRIDEVRKRLEEKNKDVGERLNQIMDKAVDRLYDYMHNDVVFMVTPNMAIDKTLKAIDLIRPKEVGVTNNTLVLATESNVSKLLEAMSMSNRAKEINAGSYTVIPATGDKAGVGVSTISVGQGNNESSERR